MRFSEYISAVDTHTEGDPTRIIIGGIQNIRGKNIQEKLHFFENNLDHLRKALMAEPRGHKEMYGCVLTGSTIEEADYGTILMDNSGYMSMCGHATIGICTALAELGMVETKEPFTRITLETPGGLVEAKVAMNNGKAESVCYISVPAYADYTDADLVVSGIGRLKVDVAYGGNYFIFFSADEIDLQVDSQNINKIVETGQRIKQAAIKEFPVQHPELNRNNFINVATILAKPTNPKAIYRNVHVLGSLLPNSLGGTGARSPGGTGLGALMAVLHAKGKLGLNQEVWLESITEGLFKGQLLAETKIGEKKGVIPEITGSAYITGFHQFVIDQEDRLKEGFLIQ